MSVSGRWRHCPPQVSPPGDILDLRSGPTLKSEPDRVCVAMQVYLSVLAVITASMPSFQRVSDANDSVGPERVVEEHHRKCLHTRCLFSILFVVCAFCLANVVGIVAKEASLESFLPVTKEYSRPPRILTRVEWDSHSQTNCYHQYSEFEATGLHGAYSYPDSEVDNVNITECKALCISKYDCEGFVWKREGSTCYMRHRINLERCDKGWWSADAYTMFVKRIVQVYDWDANLEQIVVSNATMSSQSREHNVDDVHPASNCIDGLAEESETNYCDSGEPTRDPFLRLRLPTNRYVDHVLITARKDCCKEDLEFFEVWGGQPDKWRLESMCGTGSVFREEESILIDCRQRILTDTITLVLSGKKRRLTIAEVTLYTEKDNPPSEESNYEYEYEWTPSPPPPPIGSSFDLYTGYEVYRFGDLFAVEETRGTGWKTDPWGMNYHFRTFPDSIAVKYMRATNDMANYDVLSAIVSEYDQSIRPPRNSVTVHLRVGDVFEERYDGASILSVEDLFQGESEVCWEKSTWGTTSRYCYIKNKQYYERQIRKIPVRVKKAIIVAGAHQVTDFTRSSEYIRRVQNFIILRGFTVDLRLGHPPDDDIVFIGRSDYFLMGGGGFSTLLGGLVGKLGGKVLSDPEMEDRAVPIAVGRSR